MQVIANALRIIECVVEHQPIGVTGIARILDLPKASVQRALTSLESSGWLARDRVNPRSWVQTPRIWVLAHTGRGLEILELTRDVLQHLHEVTDENVHVSRREGDDLIIVDRIESTKLIRVNDPIGNRVPLHLSGSGRAMLATWSPDQIDDYIDRRSREDHGSPPLDPDQLRRELEETRRVGYAVNRGSWRPEVSGVSTAVPLNGPGESAEYALAISIPTHRLDESKVGEYSELVLQARASILSAAGVADPTNHTTGAGQGPSGP